MSVRLNISIKSKIEWAENCEWRSFEKVFEKAQLAH